jgi:hypothetical protein
MTQTSNTVLCILREDSLTSWMVSSCAGIAGGRKVLKRFATREQAIEYALQERNRILAEGGAGVDIHLPDDCPCVRTSR